MYSKWPAEDNGGVADAALQPAAAGGIADDS
jgi:hypothetical protein